MSGYIGAQPVPQATQHREAFTATASQTSFATVGYTPQFVDVYLNGVKLAAADYTATNGSDIVLTTGAALDDILEYVAYTPFEVADQTFTGTTTTDVLTTTGAFTSRGIDDNATSTAITIDSSKNVGIGTTSPDFPFQLVGGGAAEYSTMDISHPSGTSGLGAKLYMSGLNAPTVRGTIIEALKGASNKHDLLFYTNSGGAEPTERMRIDSSGHAIIPAGVTLGTAAGVYSADNTLDDYEEGTWTPVVEFGGGSVGIVYSKQVGKYTKVGNVVTISTSLSLTNKGSSTGNAYITGLPFTATADLAGSQGGGVAAVWSGCNSLLGITVSTTASSSELSLWRITSSTSSYVLRFDNADANNDFSVNVTMQYYTDS